MGHTGPGGAGSPTTTAKDKCGRTSMGLCVAAGGALCRGVNTVCLRSRMARFQPVPAVTTSGESWGRAAVTVVGSGFPFTLAALLPVRPPSLGQRGPPPSCSHFPGQTKERGLRGHGRPAPRAGQNEPTPGATTGEAGRAGGSRPGAGGPGPCVGWAGWARGRGRGRGRGRLRIVRTTSPLSGYFKSIFPGTSSFSLNRYVFISEISE